VLINILKEEIKLNCIKCSMKILGNRKMCGGRQQIENSKKHDRY
jgi:hypothetical protein